MAKAFGLNEANGNCFLRTEVVVNETFWPSNQLLVSLLVFSLCCYLDVDCLYVHPPTFPTNTLFYFVNNGLASFQGVEIC